MFPNSCAKKFDQKSGVHSSGLINVGLSDVA
jgi:hypothetical protein